MNIDPFVTSSCLAFIYFSQALLLAQFVVAARKSLKLMYKSELTFTPPTVFSGLRVFALSNRNVWVFLAVFLLNMVSFGVNMVSAYCLQDGALTEL